MEKEIKVMQMLAELKGRYLDANGNDLLYLLLVGKSDGYCKPENYSGIIRRSMLELHKSFSFDESGIKEEVARTLRQNKRVVVGVCADKKRVEIYL